MQRVRADSTRYAGLQHIGSDPVKSVAALQRPVAVMSAMTQEMSAMTPCTVIQLVET
jgi:hypothetical protein